MGRAATTPKGRKAFGYKVDIEHRCFHSESSDEAYGKWREDWSNSFRTIRRMSPTDSHPDAVAAEDFVPGEAVYVVWAEWTQADSFGSASNRGVDTLGVFRTREQAQGLEKLARAAKDYEPTPYLGLEYYFGDFKGYFDRLEAIHIEPTHIDR
jgi:hypothetical protein